jgi:hypothetical protein
MRNKLLSFLCISLLTLAFSACAQSKQGIKKTSQSGKKTTTRYITYLESLKERTLPGRPETPITETIYHIVIWNSSELPQAFYWKNKGVWTPCDVSKAQQVKKLGIITYNTTDIRMEHIKKGDTLQLIPQAAEGKYAPPAEVPDTVTSTIFYKTAKTKWLPLPVEKYRNLPDIIMP